MHQSRDVKYYKNKYKIGKTDKNQYKVFLVGIAVNYLSMTKKNLVMVVNTAVVGKHPSIPSGRKLPLVKDMVTG